MRRRLAPSLALVAVAFALALAPAPARAEGWIFDIHEDFTFGIDGALDAPLGMDSRAGLGARLGASVTSDGGHGVGFSLAFIGDAAGEHAPSFLHFTADLLYVFRTEAGLHELVTLGLGPSIGFSDAVFADCSGAAACTPEDIDSDAFYDSYDSIVFGGTLSFAFDHPFEESPLGLYVGLALDGHVLYAPDGPETQGAPVRFSGGLALRFGGRFDL